MGSDGTVRLAIDEAVAAGAVELETTSRLRAAELSEGRVRFEGRLYEVWGAALDLYDVTVEETRALAEGVELRSGHPAIKRSLYAGMR